MRPALSFRSIELGIVSLTVLNFNPPINTLRNIGADQGAGHKSEAMFNTKIIFLMDCIRDPCGGPWSRCVTQKEP